MSLGQGIVQEQVPIQRSPAASPVLRPQQALFALNSPFILARSDALAKRMAEVQPTERVARLFAALLGREPSATERDECEKFVATGSIELLAQVLLMSNELMFVD